MSHKNTNESATEVWEDTREVTRRFAEAVRDALREHKRAGNPVAIWRDGKVVLVPPQEIPDDENESANGTVDTAMPTPKDKR